FGDRHGLLVYGIRRHGHRWQILSRHLAVMEPLAWPPSRLRVGNIYAGQCRQSRGRFFLEAMNSRIGAPAEMSYHLLQLWLLAPGPALAEFTQNSPTTMRERHESDTA